MVAPDEKARVDALMKWAKRVFDSPSEYQFNVRRHFRKQLNDEARVIPLDPATLQPNVKRSHMVVTKDESVAGLGIVSDIILEDDLYFIELIKNKQIMLCRKTRTRPLRGSITEYGFQVLDRYGSFQELLQI